MDQRTKIAIFKGWKVRKTIYQNEWWFSVVDVCGALTESADSGAYWRKLKQRLKEEGSEVVTFCHELKLQSADGKYYKTDVADVETLLRLIQSVPSPKAEPVKLWLARVGYERMQEISDPEKSLNRARENWQKIGRSEKWSNFLPRSGKVLRGVGSYSIRGLRMRTPFLWQSFSFWAFHLVYFLTSVFVRIV